MYYELSAGLLGQQDAIVFSKRELVNLSAGIFDLEIVKDYDRNSVSQILKSQKRVALPNPDRLAIREYANRLYYLSAITVIFIRGLEVHKTRATKT